MRGVREGREGREGGGGGVPWRHLAKQLIQDGILALLCQQRCNFCLQLLVFDGGVFQRGTG